MEEIVIKKIPKELLDDIFSKLLDLAPKSLRPMVLYKVEEFIQDPWMVSGIRMNVNNDIKLLVKPFLDFVNKYEKIPYDTVRIDWRLDNKLVNRFTSHDVLHCIVIPLSDIECLEIKKDKQIYKVECEKGDIINVKTLNHRFIIIDKLVYITFTKD